MKSAAFLSLLLCSGLSAACGGHEHDDKEWSKEELAELEEKWGHEVSYDSAGVAAGAAGAGNASRPLLRGQLLTDSLSVGLLWNQHICTLGACQVPYNAYRKLRYCNHWSTI